MRTRVNAEWLRGEMQGKLGIFPANYVSFESGNLNQLLMEKRTSKTFTAEYNYCSDVVEDLEFKAGDVIEFISNTQSPEWIMGKVGIKTGLVPLTYVRKN